MRSACEWVRAVSACEWVRAVSLLACTQSALDLAVPVVAFTQPQGEHSARLALRWIPGVGAVHKAGGDLSAHVRLAFPSALARYNSGLGPLWEHHALGPLTGGPAVVHGTDDAHASAVADAGDSYLEVAPGFEVLTVEGSESLRAATGLAAQEFQLYQRTAGLRIKLPRAESEL